MRFSTTSFIALIAAAALSGPVMAQSAREKAYDAQISPTEMVDWMKRLAAEPSHVSSPASKGNAEWVRDQFKSWGWDARIETFQVLYPTPLSESLEIVGPTPFKASSSAGVAALRSTTAEANPANVIRNMANNAIIIFFIRQSPN